MPITSYKNVVFSEDINLLGYKIILKRRIDGELYIISDPSTGESIVERFSIEEDADTPVIEVNMSVRLTDQTFLFTEGDHISIYAPYVNFDGRIEEDVLKGNFVILSIEREVVSARMNIIMRNIAHWVTKINLSLKIEKGETASSFITRTAQQHGIPIESIPSETIQYPITDALGFKLNATFFPSISLYNAWLTALSIAMREDNRFYRLRFGTKGLIIEELEKVEAPVSTFWMFEVTDNHSNIMDASRRTSIIDREFINVARGVVLPSQSDDVLSSLYKLGGYIEESDSESINRYGAAYTEVDVGRFNGNEKEIRNYLKQMLKDGEPKDDIEFTTPVLNSLLPLDRIYVTLPLLGLADKYFIKHLTTNVLPGDYSHTISATKIQELPFDITNLTDGGGDALDYVANI